MEVCWACGEKRTAHTETEAKTQPEGKTQSPSQADMWCAIKFFTHIKSVDREDRVLALLTRETVYGRAANVTAQSR